MCCCVMLAYSIASISTPQVGGSSLWPPAHLVSPSCTAPSSSKGWELKHASIACLRSPTPSRTALPLPADFLLTYVLKSLRWSVRPAERTTPSHPHSSHVMSNLTHQSLPVTTSQEVLVQVLSLYQNKREERVILAAAVTTRACAMMHACT